MSEVESTRQALEEAVAQASRAAELTRLLADHTERLAQAAQAQAEAEARRQEAEARIKEYERQLARLAKELADQRYQTAVAQWKLDSLNASRWSRLGQAIHSKNPATVAKTLKTQAERRPAPKRSDFKPEPPVIAVEPVRPAAPPPAPQVSKALAEGFTVPKGPLARPYLTAAAIVDRQTEALLRYEWRQVTNFGPENWQRMLDEHQPHLLFVESVRPGARQGNGGRWLEALTGESRALRDLVEACRKRGIRTVFWHSGGPVSAYVPAASLFDHVLVASEPRSREWRSALRHDRVTVLPHAVQPRVHNLIPAAGGRTGEVRTLGTVPDAPEEWRPLPGQRADDKITYDDLLTAYRTPALVVAGPDADPRTLAELAACGTPVVTAPRAEAAAEAAALLADAARRDRQAHLAWRASTPVTPLLDPIFDLIGVPSVRNLGAVSAITYVCGQAELDHLLAQLRRQVHRPGQLVVVAEGVEPAVVEKAAGAVLEADLVVRAAEEPTTRGLALDRALRLADGDLVAVFDSRDRYGAHYLADLVRYFAAVDAEIVGKASCYAQLPGITVLRQPGAEHRFLPEVAGGTVLARRPALTALGFADVSEEWGEALMRQCRADGIRVYSADRYSYVCVRDTPESALLASAVPQGDAPVESLALLD